MSLEKETELDRSAIPGSVRLVDAQNELLGVTERGDIILVPQPTSDPEDPLNWGPWRKRRALWLAYFYTFAIAWASAAVYSILVPVSVDTGLSVNNLNSGSGTMLLFFGWGALLAQPFALRFGRRGVLTLSLAATVAVSCWTAYAPSYAAWVSTRVILGFVGSPIEVVPELIVTDLYFNHQRGRHIGVYMLMLGSGAYLCSVFSGIINDTMGWQWVMYWCAIINAIGVVLLFFGLEETMYYRNTGFEAARIHSLSEVEIVSAPVTVEKGTEPSSTSASTKEPASELPPTIAVQHITPRTYLQKLTLFRTIPEQPNQFLSHIYQPLINLWTFPLVLWAGLFHGISILCFNALNATASVILSAPPYNFKSSYVGLAYIGAVIGSILGGYWGGEINDKICLYMARRNKNGMREAEHRLYAASALCIIPPVGFIVWGVGSVHGVHWIGLVIGMTMLGFAMMAGGGIMLNYVVDSYKELAGTTLPSINVVRCTMAFGFGYAVTPWLEATGTQNTFITWSLMSFALFATFVPMIIWGKKLRIRSTKAYWVQVEKSLALGL